METDDIVTRAQAACILEVSCPKPGNVSRYHDFEDTRYEDFLVSGIAIGGTLRKAVERGIAAARGEIDIEDMQIGSLIKEAVLYSRRWHSGGNTNLGITMLLVPLCTAFGMSIPKELEDGEVRENIERIIKGTTSQDAVDLFDAIRATRPGGMGKVKTLDVMEDASLEELKQKDKNLYDVMLMTEEDSIARELTTAMEISFEVGSPAIIQAYEEKRDITHAILYGFLKILSQVPDTLIARKAGKEVAQEVSDDARKLLDSCVDEKMLETFDAKLRSKDNLLNPGTTADLVTSSLMVALIHGVRP